MKRVEELMSTRRGGDSADVNRFYSILLDSRTGGRSTAQLAPGSMADIAEKLIEGEKENAKIALEQLWALKKNLVTGRSGAIDRLIRFYQEKIDLLRTREEQLRKASREARDLGEEKKKRDGEAATVRKQAEETAKEIANLNSRLERLTVREQELGRLEKEIAERLSESERVVVEGLSQIILTRDGVSPQGVSPQGVTPQGVTPQGVTPLEPVKKAPPPAAKPSATKLTPSDIASLFRVNPEEVPLSRFVQTEQKPPFPRWLIKTTLGHVIGEYSYDGTVEKGKRHYIFNSRFFGRVASDCLRQLREKFDQAVYLELLQMIQDAHKRINGSERIHFEISTSEILNEESLKRLWIEARSRSFDDMDRFCARLLAKIETMGRNYHTLLVEQMRRSLTA